LQTYLINLDRAPERLQRMKGEFARLGLEFTRVAGVDGAQLSDEEIKRYQPEAGTFGLLSRGEVGCFMSHRLCWRAIADGPSEFGAVFEDDILVSSRAAELLKNIDWIPADSDVVKLDAAPFATFIGRHRIALPEGTGLHRLCFNHYCAGGYILSRTVAARLLKETEIFTAPVDEVMFNVVSPIFHDLQIYQIVPAICTQERYVLPPETIEGPESYIENIGNRKFKGRLKRRKKVLRELYSGLNRIGTWVGIRQRLIVEFDVPYCEGV